MFSGFAERRALHAGGPERARWATWRPGEWCRSACPGMDAILVTAVVVLIAFGIVMVASASMHLGERSGDQLRFVNRHLFALALGISLGAVVF